MVMQPQNGTKRLLSMDIDIDVVPVILVFATEEESD